MNVIAELFGGPHDGATWPLENVPVAPSALTFAAARAVVGWDVASISETTYVIDETVSSGPAFDIVRYEHVR